MISCKVQNPDTHKTSGLWIYIKQGDGETGAGDCREGVCKGPTDLGTGPCRGTESRKNERDECFKKDKYCFS